jgi:hypothetical protein
MTRLPEEECAFYFAAMATLVPELRPVFAERVANILDAYSPFCDPGPGDVDRAIRAALVGLWVPPPVEEVKNASRWNRSVAGFERISKAAQPVEVKRRRRLPAGHGYVPA